MYFDDYERRQSYEWKFVVVLWTPLAAGIGFMLKDSQLFFNPLSILSLSIALALLHAFWQYNLARSNSGDIQAFRDVADNLRLGVGFKEYDKDYPAKPDPWWRSRRWSHWTYMFITILLLIGVNGVNGVNRSNRSIVVPVPKAAIAALRERASQANNTPVREAQAILKDALSSD